VTILKHAIGNLAESIKSEFEMLKKEMIPAIERDLM
jgi:hypothetical protein